MDKSESKKENRNGQKRRLDPELLKKGLRCDIDQYEMLKRCSEKGAEGIKEWNEWFKKNHWRECIILEGADFCDAYLEGALLWGANIKEAQLINANLECADLTEADLSKADLTYAHLKGTNFTRAKLKMTDFEGAQLEGAWFDEADLRGAQFQWSSVDGATLIRNCKIDSITDFSAVGLEGTRIEPATKQLLNYNVRCLYWKRWYSYHPKLRWLVKPFWLMSDYGLSTGRVIVTFFALALVFANIYHHWGRIAPPGIVENLFVDRNGIVIPSWLVPLRTLYFSIVTMTTLGFGDMYANAQSIWGHILLSMQVILGYVLLGALVTRFAVLFTAGGPARRFADEKKTSKIS